MEDIEDEIREVINDVTGEKYITKLQVTKEGDIWTLYLYLNRELVPMVMSIEGSFDLFKRFVAYEIKHRRLNEVKYWKTDLTLPSLQCNGDGELELGW